MRSLIAAAIVSIILYLDKQKEEYQTLRRCIANWTNCECVMGGWGPICIYYLISWGRVASFSILLDGINFVVYKSISGGCLDELQFMFSYVVQAGDSVVRT